MKKAFGYLRVSGKSQVEGDGFDRQREKIEKFAAANGIEIVQWFEEKGVSGSIEERPALTEMMVALMSNGVRIFMIEKLDRLARDPMIQEHIIADCRQREIEIISADEPDLCKDDPTRELLRVIMGAISRYDKKMIVLKLKAARSRMKSKTGRCEGIKPYGELAGESDTLARMNSLRASGRNYEQIAKQLNVDGLATRSGGVWFAATVRKIVLAQQAQ